MQRIGVLGSGDVGQTLAAGFTSHGYEVKIAVAYPPSSPISHGSVGFPPARLPTWRRGARCWCWPSKIVIGTTNPIDDDAPVDGVLRVFTGPNESLHERLQAAFPKARFVKAFGWEPADMGTAVPARAIEPLAVL